ncbi:MAG: hypothetical protein Q8P59_08680, partial [Dehalococcoidia bacterium]|nr:hypothetical protein [Dehalococcoidia bacterium]
MRNLGLGSRIILIAALGLAAILSLFGYLAVTAAQQSKDLVLQERLALSETISGHIDYTLNRILRQLVETVNSTPTNQRTYTLDDEKQLLSDTYHKLGAFTTMELVGKDGTEIWTEPPLTDS